MVILVSCSMLLDHNYDFGLKPDCLNGYNMGLPAFGLVDELLFIERVGFSQIASPTCSDCQR